MAEFSSIEWSKTLLKLFKYSGFSTFSIENNKSVLKKVDILCFIYSFLLGISIFAISMMTLNFDFNTKNAVILVGNQIAANAAIFVAVIAMCFSFFARNKNWQNIINIHHIDLEVKDT